MLPQTRCQMTYSTVSCCQISCGVRGSLAAAAASHVNRPLELGPNAMPDIATLVVNTTTY